MTATRERQSSSSPVTGAPEWSERSAFGSSRGVPLWAAILLAVVPTALGTLLDVLIWSTPGLLFTACFFVGSVLAVALVRRKMVFGPMVQSPLIVSVVMPLTVLLTGSGAKSGGASSKVFSVANPLINSFPAMATTAGVALILGLVRMFALEPAPAGDGPDSEAHTKQRRRPKNSGRGKPEARKRPAEGEANRKPPREGRPGEGPSKPPRGEHGRAQPPGQGANRPAADRKRPEQGAAGANQRPASGGKRPTGEPGGQGNQGGRPRGAPGRPRGGEGKPDGGRSAPPPGQGRGGGPRPAPGRGRPPQEPRPGGEPPRRPQRPRRDDR